MRIHIYVEGGGDGQALRTKCRQAFSKFFEKASLKGRMPAVTACGSRNDAYDSYCTALKIAKPSDLPILLVDSEAPVNGTPWTHLQSRDGWQKPNDSKDEHVHLMVQCMEAWFIADRDRLQTFYGQGFNANSLPAKPNAEHVNKDQILDGLKVATRHTKSKGEYNKGRHSFELLGSIDPEKVAQVCPHAKRLVDTLKARSE